MLDHLVDYGALSWKLTSSSELFYIDLKTIGDVTALIQSSTNLTDVKTMLAAPGLTLVLPIGPLSERKRKDFRKVAYRVIDAAMEFRTRSKRGENVYGTVINAGLECLAMSLVLYQFVRRSLSFLTLRENIVSLDSLRQSLRSFLDGICASRARPPGHDTNCELKYKMLLRFYCILILTITRCILRSTLNYDRAGSLRPQDAQANQDYDLGRRPIDLVSDYILRDLDRYTPTLEGMATKCCELAPHGESHHSVLDDQIKSASQVVSGRSEMDQSLAALVRRFIDEYCNGHADGQD